MYFFDVDKIVESHFGVDVNEEEEVNCEEKKKSNVKDEMDIEVITEKETSLVPTCDGNNIIINSN